MQAPKLTADELLIVFVARDAPGGRGGSDIWMAERPDRYVPFGSPVNLIEINTASHDLSPCISSDGLSLYFARDLDEDRRLFVATRKNRKASFRRVRHLSSLDMPGMSNSAPYISADGNTLYFTSNETDHVATKDIYESFRKEPPLRLVHQAIAKNKAALGRIDLSFERENRLNAVLRDLALDGSLPDPTEQEKLERRIQAAVLAQQEAAGALEKAISQLEICLTDLNDVMPTMEE